MGATDEEADKVSTYTRRVIITDPTSGVVRVQTLAGSEGPPVRNAQANIATTSYYNQTESGAPTGQGGAFTFDAAGRTTQIGALQANFDEPTPVTVYVEGILGVNTAGASIDTDARPVAVINWGVAGKSHTITIDATLPRGKVSVVAEWVQVNVCFERGNDWFPGVGGTGIATTTSAVFNIEIALGVDPDFTHNTRLILSNDGSNANTLAAQGIIAKGPGRLASLIAWDTAATYTHLIQLYDFPTLAGLPNGVLIPFPIPPAPQVFNLEIDENTDITFQTGLVWQALTTAGAFDAAALLRVDATVLR